MSKNTNTLINRSVTPPIETLFGLHFLRLGTLPNQEQWQQIKSYIQSYSPVKLLTASIQPELDILSEHPDYALEVRVPTLGFTDLAFDYDIRPWFLTPVVINHHIAQTGTLEHTKVADLWVTDIAENYYQLLFSQTGQFDYDKMSEQAGNGVVFTTLKNIHYIFSLPTLLGEGLEALPENKRASQAALLHFFPPPVLRKKYEIELLILDGQRNKIQKRTVEIQPETQQHLFVSHFETLHSRSVEAKIKQESLGIKVGLYVEQELPCSRYGYKIKLSVNQKIKLGKLSAYTQPLPYHFRPGMDYLRVKNNNKKQSNIYEYVLFFGLSHSAMNQLIQIIISKERFFKNHLISSVQQKNKNKNQFNYYYLQPDLIDKLYEGVTNACAHKTIPLYALSESFELSAIIFSKLMNLDTSLWDGHDQWVFERMFYEQLSSIRPDYDPTEVGFEWVDKIDKLLNEHQTDIDIQNNIDILSGKLSAEQLIEVDIYLEDSEKSALIKYEEGMPSLTLTKTLESTEFDQRYGKNIVIKNTLPL